MRIFQKFKTLPLFISYFFKVVDRHSLQAPFIYGFYSDLLESRKHARAFEDIEEIRKSYKKSKKSLEGSDLGAGSQVIQLSGGRKVSSIARFGISSKKECVMFWQLLRMFKPNNCLELGTSLGIVTAYLSRAIPEGEIFTFEGDVELCDLAQHNWEQLKCDNIQLIQGDINIHLPQKLTEIGEIDFAIIDANHTKKALLSYFELIFTHLSTDGIIYIDDIRWSLEMYDAWQMIINDERVTISVEFLNAGIVFFKPDIPRQHYILSY